ncbi:similar to Saccharomyces cerevisiae YCR082W AHC2 Component of the ADA histone acetyltransferase complex [Maudiozyma barnettii]|uniref:Similar to Saccharomyces cerevisiae YCR082W AHC2 Component of the ADA histone acetyltransferase complex n=1 Tax=Maudiozyma barnettii TaxID=61262 RepID=A0A8H2VFQ8_9SACH|nr:Ahc2p [Kazachstania barnettii]CAB4254779.1 similar to Saccharomyces cerevisiae YCR082W AHC2 Component of the ADA histone acetyltransferase complex [Kazachstania barnettii]CAD1782921.1 similar to Saccharomyces cerevisiae YCR082W AHC2 Component of the ADA histone acetyltransferase complex [Kazachstania barnettii]
MSKEHEYVREFQGKAVEENEDLRALLQQKKYLERKLIEKQEFETKLQQLYDQVDGTKNYQELLNGLSNCRILLSEIFTREGQAKRHPVQSDQIELDWSKYGLDLAAYVTEHEQLLKSYEQGMLD